MTLPPLMSSVVCAERTAWLPSNTGWNARKGQGTQKGVVQGGKDASRTFPGIAKAMAEQWGGLCSDLECGFCGREAAESIA